MCWLLSNSSGHQHPAGPNVQEGALFQSMVEACGREEKSNENTPRNIPVIKGHQKFAHLIHIILPSDHGSTVCWLASKTTCLIRKPMTQRPSLVPAPFSRPWPSRRRRARDRQSVRKRARSALGGAKEIGILGSKSWFYLETIVLP